MADAADLALPAVPPDSRLKLKTKMPSVSKTFLSVPNKSASFLEELWFSIRQIFTTLKSERQLTRRSLKQIWTLGTGTRGTDLASLHLASIITRCLALPQCPAVFLLALASSKAYRPRSERNPLDQAIKQLKIDTLPIIKISFMS
jgi:hypothetical protein